MSKLSRDYKETRVSLSEYYRVNDLENYDEVYKALLILIVVWEN